MAWDLLFPEHLDRNDGARTITDCVKKYFAGKKKSYTIVAYLLNDEYEVWFATLAYKKDGEYKTRSAESWYNVFAEGEDIIYQWNPSVDRMNGMEADPDRKYFLFTKSEGEQYWWFKGIYECIGREEKLGFVHRRIATEFCR